jgi:hypothetical protein
MISFFDLRQNRVVDSLRGIGYWRSATQPELPDPAAFIDPSWDEETRADICDYLHRGLLAGVYMGYSTCRICKKKDNGDLELTDMTYIWPSGLVHYVQEHLLRLPDEFVRHTQEVVHTNENAQTDWSWWARQRSY